MEGIGMNTNRYLEMGHLTEELWRGVWFGNVCRLFGADGIVARIIRKS